MVKVKGFSKTRVRRRPRVRVPQERPTNISAGFGPAQVGKLSEEAQRLFNVVGFEGERPQQTPEEFFSELGLVDKPIAKQVKKPIRTRGSRLRVRRAAPRLIAIEGQQPIVARAEPRGTIRMV